MTPSKKLINNYSNYRKPELAETAKNGDTVALHGAGNLVASTTNNSNHNVTVDIIHAPDLAEPLLSVSQAVDLPLVDQVTFMNSRTQPAVDASFIKFRDGGQIPLLRKEGLYYLPMHLARSPAANGQPTRSAANRAIQPTIYARQVTSALSTHDQTVLAHKRLCHPNGRVVINAPNMGLKIDKTVAQTLECLSCGLGKSKRKHHRRRPHRRASRPWTGYTLTTLVLSR